MLFSGGTDSTLLLKVCADTLGAKHVLAVTAVSESYTGAELESTRELATAMGVEHVVLPTAELSNPEFRANPADRCYHCKKELFAKAKTLAAERGFAVIFDGSNLDDLDDYRPGRRAAKEAGAVSPLLETGLTKADVRQLAKELGLSNWNAPANPCLASRVPYGGEITERKLRAIEQAEAFVKQLGFPVVRVRHHGDTARIEVPPQDIPRLATENVRGQLDAQLKLLGFTWVALDLRGYRTGSLNEALREGGA